MSVMLSFSSELYNTTILYCINGFLVIFKNFVKVEIYICFLQLSDVEDAECECVFTQGTPTHSRRTVTLQLPSPAPPTCRIVIYESLDACPKQATKNIPEEDAVLAQVI